MESVRHIGKRGYGGIIFRRTYPQIKNEGGLWDESQDIYPLLDGKPNQSSFSWRFPAGSTLTFSHMQHEDDRLQYDGSQIQFIGFDQLEQFTEQQFFYLLTRNRNRTSNGVRPYVRATCNPMPDHWLGEFIAWWIDSEGYIIKERCGIVRWFVRLNKKVHWGNSYEEMRTRFPSQRPKSFTFILATVYDNKILLKNDPGYLGQLYAQDNVEFMRLHGEGEGVDNRGGNWHAKPEAGKFFHEDWFQVISRDKIPQAAPLSDLLYWDLAATERELAGTSTRPPSHTACIQMRKHAGLVYIIFADWFMKGPAVVERRFLDTTRAQQRETGRGKLRVFWEMEPGSAGKREAFRLQRELMHPLGGQQRIEIARAVPSRGDKMERARPFAAAAKNGLVYVMEASWTKHLISHLHNQPQHDQDLMDCCSGSYTQILASGLGPQRQRSKSRMR